MGPSRHLRLLGTWAIIVCGLAGLPAVSYLLAGQVRRNGSLTRYYHLKDHLGSVRVTVDAAGNAVAYDDYDPWGMLMDGRSYNAGQADARYKFTSKERDTETGLDYFGARYYDSRIGRWLSVDPLGSRFSSWSPYVYALSNPILFIDPDGMASRKQRDQFYAKQGDNMLLVAGVHHGISREQAFMIVAHSSLETEYGTKLKGNAYFGIKGKSQSGSVRFATTEFYGGEQVSLIDEFRAYSDEIDATLDYMSFLSSQFPEAYRVLSDESSTIDDFANALMASKNGGGGYATDPAYRNKLPKVFARVKREFFELIYPKKASQKEKSPKDKEGKKKKDVKPKDDKKEEKR